MRRGGSRWSIAMSALFGLSLVLPAAVHAATPVSLTFTTSITAAFYDDSVTFTASMSPAVAGMYVGFIDVTSSTSTFAYTDGAGVASLTIGGQYVRWVPGPNLLHAEFPGDATYAAATSNTVSIDVSQNPSSLSLTFSGGHVSGVVHSVDQLQIAIRMTATVCGGWIDLDQVPGGQVASGPASLVYNLDGTRGCGFNAVLVPQPLGVEHYQAFYTGAPDNVDSTTGVVAVPITPIAPTLALLVSPNPVEGGTTTFLTGELTTIDDPAYVAGSGTITFYEGTTNLGSADVMADGNVGQAAINLTFNAVGNHDLHAIWNGPTYASPATSPTVTLSVVQDIVHASNLHLNASGFYPVLDGYQDRLAIEGQLDEMASVAVTITSATTGAVVDRLWVPTREGMYTVWWDGRTSNEVALLGNPFWIRRLQVRPLVPQGLYHVTQVVSDAGGATLTVTKNVTVSYKSLHWFPGTLTLYGNQFIARGGNSGTISASSTYSRGARITLAPGPAGRYIAVGYQFTLPVALGYSALTFSVLGSGNASAVIGMQDSRLGTWPAGSPWIIDYFSPIAYTSTGYGWNHVAGNSTYNRIGRTVRGMVLALDWFSGRYDIASVKVTYRYALLR